MYGPDVAIFTHVESRVERHSFRSIKTLNGHVYSAS